VKRLVIDASIAVKWVVEEEGTREALVLLRSGKLAAPDLLVPECANILWKKVQRNELTNQQALLAARLLERAEIELLPMRSLLELASRIGVELDHPAYDCLYLALAVVNDWSFATADDRFVRKLRQGRRTLFAKIVISLPEAVATLGRG
jgi:predicted nucleic acid-binding protein